MLEGEGRGQGEGEGDVNGSLIGSSGFSSVSAGADATGEKSRIGSMFSNSGQGRSASFLSSPAASSPPPSTSSGSSSSADDCPSRLF